ncbi:MAG: ORF6N domain-containing protein [Candidatus Gastranaerophilales bacterium]|nr:ORF6N domain-containing protein [Candidatus Gastranaerophilales bacterium]
MTTLVPIEVIENRIFIIRGQRVMIDSDLARLYGVETYRLNEAVKRNIERFPENFMFQLTQDEWKTLISQFAMSKTGRGGRRTPPYAFTELGVLMSANVLNNPKAISVSIQIVNTFVKLRQIMVDYNNLPQRLAEIEKLLLLYIEKTDGKLEEHDQNLAEIMHALNYLLESPKEHKQIGFRTE